MEVKQVCDILSKDLKLFAKNIGKLLSFVLVTLLIVLTPQLMQEDGGKKVLSAIKIKVDTNSPAFAALEDTKLLMYDPIYEMQWDFAKASFSSIPKKTLTTSRSINFVHLSNIANEYKKNETIVVRPLKIVAGKKNHFGKSENRTPSFITASRAYSNVDLSDEPIESYEEPNDISRRMKIRLEKLGGLETILDDAEEEETVSSLAQKLVKEELELIKATEGTAKKETPAILKKVHLTGKVEIADGLAYMGDDDYIVIYREEEGEPKESGVVWVKDGSYEIFVEEAKGKLISELRSSSGGILGETHIDLKSSSKLSSSVKVQKNKKILKMDLKISPVSDGLEGKVVSAYSFAKNDVLVDGAQVQTSFQKSPQPLQRGDFVVRDLSMNSSFQLRTQAENHWGSLVVGQNNQSYRLKLFPNKMVEALLSLAQEESSPEFQGNLKRNLKELPVVWGIVEKNGKTLASAIVEMASSSEKPIYFNSLMIPDMSLKSTSSNGLFAYVGINSGVHQIRARYGEEIFPTKVIAAQPQHVSFVKIAKAGSRMIPVKVFDAIDPDISMSAVLRVVGQSTQSFEINESGAGLINVPKDKALMFLEASPFGNYESVRLVKPRSIDYVQVPMVSGKWIDEMLNKSNVERDKNKSVLVGFVQFDSFEGEEVDNAINKAFYDVDLGSDGQGYSYSKVFFDSSGKWSETPSRGGGFILANLEKGMQTLVVTPKDDLGRFQKHSQLFIADPSVLSVVQKHYR